MNSHDILHSKVLDRQALLPRLNTWRLRDQKIVFTNGCFDILHLGHIDYLSKAAAAGNKLVVGVNSDASNHRLKGPGRPINDERSRSLLLAALFFVDAVCIFDEDTPYELIKLLRPDVLVKGADYTIEQIVGADLVLSTGGEVKTIEFLEGYSTTAIETKIRNS
ncbi:rfaE bifunctional protein nucleotidyltransferase chain/domain [Anseongella ginsenosidimutans]|uniref:D-glycero-beta-D-manno-heptose 1-phosphate adenylyltransferase n=1 Tax=Anseongella ginsenosidimutans TaxID=496056 RepID=A0A4R3L0C1_9SPHI|nr:D-glycero-beta-D-manno-heptose 1-phosphate adenylyltransferase [Anseongella ginsenosidimutans]QEC51403.1 D-glycero-beta-D-manno-heptose 1-phosphate adenylyltransferase [Anseongella ginsenosidimutans]TCS89892.1 rfaE bifunctional protein nucleotidyltransferase chain/domain [Anseongella ginsenosidimutans]